MLSFYEVARKSVLLNGVSYLLVFSRDTISSDHHVDARLDGRTVATFTLPRGFSSADFRSAVVGAGLLTR